MAFLFEKMYIFIYTECMNSYILFGDELHVIRDPSKNKTNKTQHKFLAMIN